MDSEKERCSDTPHIQPISLVPTKSQQFFDVEDPWLSNIKHVGIREGAEIRCRLFYENKDTFLPKSNSSHDDIPMINDVTI